MITRDLPLGAHVKDDAEHNGIGHGILIKSFSSRAKKSPFISEQAFEGLRERSLYQTKIKRS